MEVIFTRGESYVTTDNKINPENLCNKQNELYLAHLIKSTIIKQFNGTQPKVILDQALSRIDFSAFCTEIPLNNDQKLLLRDLIVYNLFIYDIKPDNINFNELLGRL